MNEETKKTESKEAIPSLNDEIIINVETNNTIDVSTLAGNKYGNKIDDPSGLNNTNQDNILADEMKDIIKRLNTLGVILDKDYMESPVDLQYNKNTVEDGEDGEKTLLSKIYKELDDFTFWFKDSFIDIVNVGQPNEPVIESKTFHEPEDKQEKKDPSDMLQTVLGSLVLMYPELKKQTQKVVESFMGLDKRIKLSVASNKRWDEAFEESIEMQKRAGESFKEFTEDGDVKTHDKAVREMQNSSMAMEGQSEIAKFRLRGQEGDIYADDEYGEDINLADLFNEQLHYITDNYNKFKDDKEIKKYYMSEIKKMDSNHDSFDDTDKAEKMFDDFTTLMRQKKASLLDLSSDEVERKLMYGLKKSQGGKLSKEQQIKYDELNAVQKEINELKKMGYSSDESQQIIDTRNSDSNEELSTRGYGAGVQNNNFKFSKFKKMDKEVEDKKIDKVDKIKEDTKKVESKEISTSNITSTTINQGGNIINIDKQEIFGDYNGRK
jgi:hypothetical protein